MLDDCCCLYTCLTLVWIGRPDLWLTKGHLLNLEQEKGRPGLGLTKGLLLNLEQAKGSV